MLEDLAPKVLEDLFGRSLSLSTHTVTFKRTQWIAGSPGHYGRWLSRAWVREQVRGPLVLDS